MQKLFNYTFFIALLQAFACIATAQEVIQRDTSYTIHSAYHKLKKQYPAISYPHVDVAVQEQRDVVYKTLGARTLLLDVFASQKTVNTNMTLILMVHGGGWRSGSKELLHPLARKLAKDGFVTVCVEYRLSTEAIHPAAIHDIKDALKYAMQHSAAWSVDTCRMAVLGTSAGASLASLVAVTWTSCDTNTRPLWALINIDGVVDMTDPNESAKDTDPQKPSAAAQYLGCTYPQCPELWQSASAVNHVSKGCPPTLFVNSSVPRFHAGRDSFTQQLKQLNIQFCVETLPDAPHAFWLFNPWFEPCYEAVSAFLKGLQ